jgi:hypothetical protein
VVLGLLGQYVLFHLVAGARVTSVEVILVTGSVSVVLGLLGQYVLFHLVADEVATTAAKAPPISGALLSVVLGLLGQYVLFHQSARVTSVEVILVTVLGLLGHNLFPLLMAERAGVSVAEAVGQVGENLFPHHQMAEKAEMKEVGRGKVALDLLG